METEKKILTRPCRFEKVDYYAYEKFVRAFDVSQRIATHNELVRNHYKAFLSYVTLEGKVITKCSGFGLGRKVKTDSWTDIKSVAALDSGILGLKKDGSVIYDGSNRQIAEMVGQLTDIIQIHAADSYFAALKNDGTVYINKGYPKHYYMIKTEYTSARQVLRMRDGDLVVLSDSGMVLGHVGRAILWDDVVYISSNCTFSDERILCGIKSDGTVYCDRPEIQEQLKEWGGVMSVGVVTDWEHNKAAVGICTNGEAGFTRLKTRFSVISASIGVKYKDFISLFSYDGNVWGIRENGEFQSLSNSADSTVSMMFPDKLPL